MKKILLAGSFLFSVVFANAQIMYTMDWSQRSCYKHLIVPDCPDLVCHNPEILDAISKEMFEAGNEKYIFVDLLKDGLIEENRVYQFSISLDPTHSYAEIPAELHKRYTDKWLLFVQKHSGKKEDFYSWNGFILKPGELLDPQSRFRQIDKYSLLLHGFRQKEYKYIVQEILMDGLAEPDEIYSFEVSASVLKINKRTVLEPLRTKYYQLYSDLLGMAVTKDGYGGFSSETSTTMYGTLLKE